MENLRRQILQTFLKLVTFKEFGIPSTNYVMHKQCSTIGSFEVLLVSRFLVESRGLLAVFCLPLESAILTTTERFYLFVKSQYFSQ